tara:strand:- start:3195 stop:4250 length:1056 start_codon:yes stop_codon:yes gene_type:complete
MSRARDFADLASSADAGGISGQNILYNGAMNVAQRFTSFVGVATTGYKTCDRWKTVISSSGRHTQSRASDGPSGFANSLKLDCTTADTTIATSEFLIIRQILEGQDLQMLAKGTPDAKPVTLSFYAKGTAKTYMVEWRDTDNNRMVTNRFTVSSSWQRFTFSIPADTTGTITDDNTQAFQLNFWLHAGATYTGGTYTANTWQTETDANKAVGIDSFFDSTDNELFITGVQLELGEKATPFQHLTFGDELARCQRYYEQLGPSVISSGNGYSYALASYDGSATNMWLTIDFATTKRTAPTSLDLINGYGWVGDPSVFGYGRNGITMHRAGDGIIRKLSTSSTVNTVEVDCEL